MTIPSFLSCSPRWISSFSTAVDIRWFSFLRLGRDYRSLIIHFYLRIVQDRADHLVSTGDDLVALIEASQHFDVGGTGNPRFHLLEDRFPSRHHKNALKL